MSDADELRARINAIPYWYHRIELPFGLVTPGWAPIHAAAYSIPSDLGGKRVLDVGAWDGYWSFTALARGAAEVVAVDDFSDFLKSDDPVPRRAWETFDLARAALGHDETRCQRHEMSVYDLTPSTFGRFDVVFFFGTLYHLRYPLLALDRLAALCDGAIYVESAVADHYSPYRGGFGAGYGDAPVMEFYPDDAYGGNATNWWAPTLQCLLGMVHSAGFADVRGWHLTRDAPQKLAHCRGFARGLKSAVKDDPVWSATA